MAAAIAEAIEAAELPAALIEQTVRIARVFTAGKSVGELAADTKIASLAQGVLNTMFLTKISTTVCIFALAGALVLGATPVSRMLGLTSNVQAAEVFFDDFENGSATDGNPVTWEVVAPWPSGKARACRAR